LPADHRQRRAPSEYASNLKYPCDSCIHFFFNELTARDLVDADLYLLLNLFVMDEKPSDCFLYQFVCAASGLKRKGVELRLLTISQRYFHNDPPLKNIRISLRARKLTAFPK
jgi:hypothetical protein